MDGNNVEWVTFRPILYIVIKLTCAVIDGHSIIHALSG